MTSLAKRKQRVEQQLADLHQEKSDNDLEIARIKRQLDEARGESKVTGEYADPHWYARAQFALRMRGRDSQRIQQQIGEFGRLLRKLNNAQVELCFIESARRSLSTEVFTEIWERAKALSEERAGQETADESASA